MTHLAWIQGFVRAAILAGLCAASAGAVQFVASTTSEAVGATPAVVRPCDGTATATLVHVTTSSSTPTTDATSETATPPRSTGTATATPFASASASPPPAACPARPATATPTPAATETAVVPAVPAIAVGEPSLADGKVEVPITITGANLAPYTAYQIHLRWDPAEFRLGSTEDTGTVLPSSHFCINSLSDDDGAGVILACVALSGVQTTSAGRMATIVLTPTGIACSPLHLMPGDSTGETGTFTMNTSLQVVLAATLDGSANQAGRRC